MSANLDELVPPTWLNVEFLERTLKKYKNDEGLTVTSFSTKPGSKVGEHFASVMFRIEVAYFSEKLAAADTSFLILKTMPFVEGVKMDLMRDSPLFDVEIRMYDEILPKMEPLLEANGIVKFWPKSILQTTVPASLLLFEDLSKDGYTVPKEFFTIDVGKRVLSSLAGLHATSFFMHHEQDFDFSNFETTIFTMPTDFIDKIFERQMGLFIEEVRRWPGYETYLEKLTSFQGKFKEHALKTVQSTSIVYKVLSHGDFHHKNTLVKLSADDVGVVEDYKVLDYQICAWTSPALDLVYSLYMMMGTETRDQRDDLIRHYHQEFTSILKNLQFTKRIPTLDDLNQEMQRFGWFEVLLTACFLPMMLMDWSKLDDMSKLFHDDDESKNLSRTVFQNEVYQAVVKKELPRFLELGFMDI